MYLTLAASLVLIIPGQFVRIASFQLSYEIFCLSPAFVKKIKPAVEHQNKAALVPRPEAAERRVVQVPYYRFKVVYFLVLVLRMRVASSYVFISMEQN